MLTQNDYCDYETCVALKELGYNQYTSLRSYAGKGGVRLWDFDGEPNYKEGELIALSDMYGIPRDGNEVAAPSLYETQKWLREEKNIDVLIQLETKDIHLSSKYYSIYISYMSRFRREFSYISKNFNSYEEALSEGIKEAVKILKEK